ncbi:alpha/beta fold hydrolase [Microbacterium sp.]|uniref:alpha/beta fold hydrolase n=1 Tax=Microbacterium sp. TaxID=51671 RepID=UPI003341DF8E
MTINTRVRSADGTEIAVEVSGRGPALVLVSGAFGERSFPAMRELAARLSDRFTVANYDRRGRGDSGDTAPYAVAREIDDLRAVVDSLDGPVAAWGLSSGAALVVEAVAAGVPLRWASLYEPAYETDPVPRHPRAEIAADVTGRLSRGDRSGAVRAFMTRALHVPAPITAVMRLTPAWRRLTALAHTLPYDLAVTAPDLSGRVPAPERWAAITTPIDVLVGSKSPAVLQRSARAVAEALPTAALRVLPGQNHVIDPEAAAAAVIAGDPLTPAP